MPNIPTYQQPDITIRPSETGVEAFAGAGRRAGAFLNQAGESLAGLGREIGVAVKNAGDTAVDYADHQQINAGAKHGADLFADLTQSWNQTAANADPHDPSVAAKFREEVLEPKLDQFTQGFTTEKSQEWANHFAITLRDHMYAKTEADMSSLAAEAVSNTVHTLGNQFSNTAISDPSAVPAMLAQVDHSIDGIIGANPNLKGAAAGKVKLEVGEKIKEQIVKSGAMGAIMNGGDPEGAAQRWAKQYPDYINGAEALTIAKAAKSQAKINNAYDLAAVEHEKRIANLNVEAARNKIWADNVSIGQDGEPIIKPDFFKQAGRLPIDHPNASEATSTAKTLIDWGQSQHNKEAKIATDPATASALDAGMFDPNKPTTAIDVLKAETANKLSRQDAQSRLDLIKMRDGQAEAVMKDSMFKIATDGAKELIEGRTQGEKMLAAGKYASFMQNFLGEYMRQKATGKLPPNALDLNDPESLISKSLNPYRSAISQVVSGNGGVGSGVTPKPTATPGVSETPPVSLPPLAAREKGKSYMTPRGLMEWTGTGWRPSGT